MKENVRSQSPFTIGAIIQLAIIIGYRSSSYLSIYVKWAWVQGINVIFTGVYNFLESSWVLISIALAVTLYVLIKKSSPIKELFSVCCLLSMSLGIYSFALIKKHVDDFISASKWILDVFAKLDLTTFIGCVLVLILSVTAAYFVWRIQYCFCNHKDSRSLRSENHQRITGDSQELKFQNTEKGINVIRSSGEQAHAIDDEKQAGHGIERTAEDSNIKEWWILIGTFMLAIPVFIVLVFSILQSEWLSGYEVFNKYKSVFKENDVITSMVENAIPVAMISTSIFIAGCFSFVVSTVYRGIRRGRLVHPQALAALILEIVFIACSPILRKLNTFDILLNLMADGGFVGTAVALAVLYIMTWMFLIMVSVPKGNSLEDNIRTKCKKLFDKMQSIGIGLLESGIRVIEFATQDYIEAILGVFGIESEKPNDKNSEQ